MNWIEPAIRKVGLRLLTGLCLPLFVAAQPAPRDLTGASLEDLMNMEVTSVSKREQALSKAGSSIYVITEEDIRHSGANNVPDLLRMVPGVEVARTNANAWAISIRGFHSRYSGNVLVLVDGRSVYTPLFSGVFWDQQSMPLENIARIEVIRGPGGTVWGANAVNGVINIITKSSEETQGGLISAATGSQDRGLGLLQYGGTAGAKGSYRAYGRYATTESSPSLPGQPAVDNGHAAQVGFRSDWNLAGRNKLTIQGDLSGASEGQTITTLFSNRLPDFYTFDDHVRVGQANLLGRWNHVYSNGSETTLQLYYDRVRRFDQALMVVNTGDVDFQYHFHAGPRNDIVAGLGYRLTDQSFTNGYEVKLGSGHRRDNLFSSFVQDEVQLTKTVALTIGMKLEHNAYTGYEYEPSIQLVYSPSSRYALWASASKAIQQPSWVYAEGQVDLATFPIAGGGFAVYHVAGNPLVAAPTLFDYEVGYRTEVSKRVTLDTTVFVSKYNHLQTVEPLTPFFTLNPGPPHLLVPNVFGDFGKARNYGMEISAHTNVASWWRISPGFSFLQMNASLDRRSGDTTFTTIAGDSPKRQVQLRSNIRLSHNLEWDTSAFYVGPLSVGPVPGYTRLDTRLGWNIGESVEFSIAGQNLLTPRHLEFFDTRQLVPTLVGRDVIARITWRF